ncbi:isoprenylcysteine carboxylmethyltransferase family protein [Antarcticibacterium flavum]|uniref:Isoprenylcysteine carboxylmethyltransferase family protein n=1 Tax=Antarcticibacterium flavum TaxID=2058175 RepID=A0A5B7X6V9_9FLAO|nr:MULTISPECIES: isoprenylcysteine carboxylmethyltransferase family protein [Antarcticibacterium]MCM4160685.1 isoprenylcysteine carboxylmethyltransferase family protein [Antarcticibacterium sp. W02-3]QCY71167.1 isoprenylcysteine carboxylmethyltransferase family protein [Antarcticibacterium flavum]
MAAGKKDIIFVGIQFLLFAAYLFEVPHWSLNLPSNVDLVHLGLAIAGIVIILVAMLQLNKNLSPFPTPKKNSALVTTGLFQYFRHPIYTGIMITAIFFGLYLNSGYKLMIAVLLIILFYFKSNYEEQGLEDKFPGYKGYKASTGRFWPRF